jgi:hypothetical protein
MKRKLFLLTLVMVLALLTTALVRIGSADARPDGAVGPPGTATLSGGRYHLTSLTWQVSGTASGGGYRLLGPAQPALQGPGCCCLYLPVLFKKYTQ